MPSGQATSARITSGGHALTGHFQRAAPVSSDDNSSSSSGESEYEMKTGFMTDDSDGDRTPPQTPPPETAVLDTAGDGGSGMMTRSMVMAYTNAENKKNPVSLLNRYHSEVSHENRTQKSEIRHKELIRQAHETDEG